MVEVKRTIIGPPDVELVTVPTVNRADIGAQQTIVMTCLYKRHLGTL